jgi:hypothetical protein
MAGREAGHCSSGAQSFVGGLVDEPPQTIRSVRTIVPRRRSISPARPSALKQQNFGQSLGVGYF